ncbi:flagellar motor switch protein FliN [Candidatus Nitrospira neomarina]|uniref:Flagellar motor switch protein FliN n=1 Tax=Candidatus Nitrospira neomarina TaxID=3020899 RepID=A0AA96GLS1_9BACT|nr:flagellar motor switch protein FliN [Candidatus Nitrospira neomarina]WNM62770.1 flagellar motor switch protein FliN [Candidatus Nitrospira neomarina]
MSEDENIDLDTFDAEKEMMEALAQEAATKEPNSAAKKQEVAASTSSHTPQLNGSHDQNLNRILDIPLVLSAQLGNTRMLIKDLLQLGPGSIVELDKLAGEPLEVLVNERLVARGEVVMVNEKFGIRLTDVISPTERVNKLR